METKVKRFITPCFVRVKNDGERHDLIRWLCRIGYRVRCTAGATIIIDSSIGTAFVGNYSDSERRTGRIDCGTSVELFKALVAMNDENDREQWFIATAPHPQGYHEEGIWYKSLCMKWSGFWRKATAEEIIEHFKTREQ